MIGTPIKQRRFIWKDTTTSQHFKTEPKLPKVKTVNLTTFEKLHGCTMDDVFLSPI